MRELGKRGLQRAIPRNTSAAGKAGRNGTQGLSDMSTP